MGRRSDRVWVGLMAACVVGLAGCDQLIGQQPTPTATPATTPSSGAGATQPVDVPPPIPPGLLGIANSVTKWNGATDAQRKQVAEEIARRTGGIDFKNLQTFSCGGRTHDVAIFDHEKTGLEFALIPGGTFQMGSPKGEKKRSSDETRHEVRLTKGFLMSRTEVTQDAYRKISGNNPSKFKGGSLPVEMVSYVKASKFARRSRCALPTEAQWEYACRAGTQTAYAHGKSAKQLGDYGWYAENSGDSTQPVGQKQPNAFGLYDMHGNVFEWTKSGLGDYPEGSATDPEGDKEAGHKATRGGCYMTPEHTLRSAFRLGTHESDPQSGIGIRLVKTLNLE